MPSLENKEKKPIKIDFTIFSKELIQSFDYSVRRIILDDPRNKVVEDIIREVKSGQRKLNYRRKSLYLEISSDIGNYITHRPGQWIWFIARHSWKKTLDNWWVVKEYMMNNGLPHEYLWANFDIILQSATLEDWYGKIMEDMEKEYTEESLEQEIREYLVEGRHMRIYPTRQFMGASLLFPGLEPRQEQRLEEMGGIKGLFQKFGFERIKNNFLLLKPLLAYDGAHILLFEPLSWFLDRWAISGEYDVYSNYVREKAQWMKKKKFQNLIELEEENPFFPELKIFDSEVRNH